MILNDINWLKSHYQMIHYFGLGFIQLKLDQKHRMHFYTPHLPPIIPEEDVHNHRYDFTSKILKGSLVQEIYGTTSGDKYIKHFESCKEGVEVDDFHLFCDLVLTSRHTYSVGSEYFISHETFHKVKAIGECITLITRGDYQKEFAEVVQLPHKKVCPFSVKIDEKDLWDIVEKML